MTKKKEQKIVVFTNLSPSDNMLILNGIKIASMFKKELCLVYNYPKNKKKKHEQFKVILNSYVFPIKNEIPGLKVSTLLFSERKTDLPEKLSDDYEAIFIIADADKFSKFSKVLFESPIPFLFVNSKSKISSFNKIVLPIDMRKECSDTALWSSYFGRFSKAEIVVVAANDKGKQEQKQIAKNIVLTKKLFQKFNVKHKIYKGNKSSLRNVFEASKLAHISSSDLFVILGSSNLTPLDWLIGLPERKIIKKAGDLPVLVINSLRDNYILCD